MQEHLELHLREYTVKCRATATEMTKLWQDLEVSESARQIELGRAMTEACSAWHNALTRCTQQRAEVAAHISALLDQMGTIAEELGEASNMESRVRNELLRVHTSICNVCQPGLYMSHLYAQEGGLGGTVMAQRLRAEKELADWKDRRAVRLSQVEELQACASPSCL